MFINSYTVSDVNEAFNRKKIRNFDAEAVCHLIKVSYLSNFCGQIIFVPFGIMLT